MRLEHATWQKASRQRTDTVAPAPTPGDHSAPVVPARLPRWTRLQPKCVRLQPRCVRLQPWLVRLQASLYEASSRVALLLRAPGAPRDASARAAAARRVVSLTQLYATLLAAADGAAPRATLVPLGAATPGAGVGAGAGAGAGVGVGVGAGAGAARKHVGSLVPLLYRRGRRASELGLSRGVAVAQCRGHAHAPSWRRCAVLAAARRLGGGRAPTRGSRRPSRLRMAAPWALEAMPRRACTPKRGPRPHARLHNAVERRAKSPAAPPLDSLCQVPRSNGTDRRVHGARRPA